MGAKIEENMQVLELSRRPLHDELLKGGHAEIHPRLEQMVWHQQDKKKTAGGKQSVQLDGSLTSSSQYRRITSRADSVIMGASRTSLVKSLAEQKIWLRVCKIEGCFSTSPARWVPAQHGKARRSLIGQSGD